MGQVQGIHLGWVVVRDLDAALKFYTEVVGLILRSHTKEYGWAELSGTEGAILGIAQASPKEPHLPGTNAILTLSIANLDQTRRDFLEKGGSCVGEALEIPGHVRLQTFRDPDGNTFQFVQSLS